MMFSCNCIKHCNWSTYNIMQCITNALYADECTGSLGSVANQTKAVGKIKSAYYSGQQEYEYDI